MIRGVSVQQLSFVCLFLFSPYASHSATSEKIAMRPLVKSRLDHCNDMFPGLRRICFRYIRLIVRLQDFRVVLRSAAKLILILCLPGGCMRVHLSLSVNAIRYDISLAGIFKTTNHGHRSPSRTTLITYTNS